MYSQFMMHGQKNIKLDLKKWDMRLWAEFIWLMVRSIWGGGLRRR